MAGKSFIPQSRESYWGCDWDKISKAALYEERVLRLVQRGMVKDILRHPWQATAIHQHHVPRTSVRLFSSAEAHRPLSHTINSAREWFETCENLENRHQDNQTRPTRGKLILMEGLDLRFAELLGVELGIPPEFWLAHCDGTCYLTVVDNKFCRKTRSTYWNVTIPQFRGIPDNQQQLPKGPYLVEAGPFDRYADVGEEIILFDNSVSFWGHTDDEGGWTAVILVDPRHVKLRMSPDNPHFSGKHDVCISLDDEGLHRPNLHIQAAEEDWRGHETTQPHLRGFYDTLEKAHSQWDEEIKGMEDPFEATYLSRNLIHSIWDEYTSWLITNVEDELSLDTWEFEELSVDTAIEYTKTHDTFKKYETAFAFWKIFHRCRLEIRRIKDSFTATNFNDTRDNRNDGTPTDIEEKRWTRLGERWGEVEAALESFMGSLSTRADILNVVASQREARSSGHLTKLATFAVPLSVVSAILSMGGEYAAGEKGFWIFWAISVPITAVLFLWVVLSARLSPKWDNIINRTKKGSKKKYRAMFPKREKHIFGSEV